MQARIDLPVEGIGNRVRCRAHPGDLPVPSGGFTGVNQIEVLRSMMKILMHSAKVRLMGVSAPLFILGALLSGAPGTAGAAEVVDRVVASVNEDIITLHDLNKALQPYARKIVKSRYSPEKEKAMLYKVRGDLLDRLIDDRLTVQEVKRARIKVGKQEVDRAIERIKEANFFTQEELEAALKREGLSIDDLREKSRNQILKSRLLNYKIKQKIVVTKEDIAEYYNAHPEEFTGEVKYRLRNIILEVSALANADEKQAIREKMVGIRGRALAGESFPDLAKKYSQSSLGAEGGDLGEFRPDQLSPLIKEAVASLSEGGVTEVLETEYGFQLFQVVKINQSSGKTLEAASEGISKKLYDGVVEKKFAAWLKDLREDAHIRIIK